MSLNVFLTLLPYVISLGVSLVFGIYCLRRSDVPGASPYGWLALAQAVWVGAFMLALTSPDLDWKIFWGKIEWLAVFTIPYTFPIFTAQFIRYDVKRMKLLRLILAIVPIGMTILILTEPYHHWFYPDVHIVSGNPFATLEYDFSPLVRGYGLYSILVIFLTIAALARHYIHPHHLYRWQVLTVILAALIPTGATILSLTGTIQKDITPLTFTLRNLIIFWALFRYRLFDIMPIARDTVIENISDPVIVVDVQDRVVDINPAALANIGIKTSRLAIGQPLEIVFAQWPEFVHEFKGVTQAKTQIMAKVNGRKHHFDLNISPLYERNGRFVGRVFVAREITEHTRLEQRLQRLNNGLEERVRERTTQLNKAYDTTLQGWAKALEFRDKETEGHSRRVTEMTLNLARVLKIPEDELVHIRRGALLHDIGKMAIPDEILRKGGDLTGPEKEVVSQHPLTAYELLSPIPYLEKALEIPYCHHERWDGSGYPRGLKGEEIPLPARIFTVVDVWDALQSDRPYRKAWPKETAIEYMKTQAAIIFDPHVLEVFLDLLEQDKI